MIAFIIDEKILNLQFVYVTCAVWITVYVLGGGRHQDYVIVITFSNGLENVTN